MDSLSPQSTTYDRNSARSASVDLPATLRESVEYYIRLRAYAEETIGESNLREPWSLADLLRSVQQVIQLHADAVAKTRAYLGCLWLPHEF